MFGFANFLLLALFAAAVFDLIFALARGGGLRGALHGLWNTPHLLFGQQLAEWRLQLGRILFAAGLAAYEISVVFCNSMARQNWAWVQGVMSPVLEWLAFLCFGAKILFGTRYTWRELLAGGALYFIARWVYFNSQNIWWIGIVVAVLAAKDVPLRRPLQVYFASGCAAMAVVLGEGISEMKGGPGLMFVYLVNVFNAMPAGRIIGAIFYICVLFAGVSSIVNLYEAPIAFLQEQFKFKRAVAVGVIGVIGLIVSISIQPWTSQWMDVVSIYICPLGAALAGVMFFWVLSKKSALEEVNNGAKKPIGPWFYILGKYIYIPFAIAALVLGIKYGGIG